MKYRQAVVAGQFYPQSAAQLGAELHSFFISRNVSSPTLSLLTPLRAIIVPHAGYFYSGEVAAAAYVYLKSPETEIKRVVLLGPGHRVPLSGVALSTDDLFSTPLGDVQVCHCEDKRLLDADLVSVNDSAHLFEHSLEVQLPFLQYCLSDFTIIPLVVGECQADRLSRILALLLNAEPATLVVVSSDLSHYHPYREAQQRDNRTIDKILAYNNRLKGEDACGCFAVNGLLAYAEEHKWQIKLTRKANSGDRLNKKNEVVGYASFILY